MTFQSLSSPQTFRRTLAGSLALVLASSPVFASPLDDRIKEFEKAADQNEAAVLRILELGLQENQSARAYAATKAWMAKQSESSPDLSFQAARVAERAGEWTTAVSFYRKVIKNPNANPAHLNVAVPAAYRLLISQLNTPETAYLLMREDGARLRDFGDAKRFDQWYLDQARRRGDLAGLAERLTLILNTDEPIEPFQRHLSGLFAELETYQHGDDVLYAALDKLAAAKRATAGDQARIAWVKEIVPLSKLMAERISNRKEIPDTILTSAIRKAEQLVAALPYEGSIAVINGWMNFNHGDTPTFARYVSARRADKAAPILQALPKMTPDQARRVLDHSVNVARGRRAAEFMFSRAELRGVVPQIPAVFNTLSAPLVPLVETEMTADEAKKMAPHLARNPHGDAAVIRVMATGKKRFTDATDETMKSEAWRYNDIKAATHGLWNNPWFERVGKAEDMYKKYEDFGSSYKSLSDKITKKAESTERMQAFDTLLKDLRAPSPSIPGALALWGQLFTHASDKEKSEMFKILVSDLSGDNLHLFRSATANCYFGGQKYAVLHSGPVFSENWVRWGRDPLVKALPEFADHLAGILQSQMNAGEISGPIFSAWLHCVDAANPKARQFMGQLANSPAYAKLDSEYRRLAANTEIFGQLAVSPTGDPRHPASISRELLALGANATGPEIETALETVTAKAAAADRPVTIIGLQAVASLKEWSPATRQRVLSLFNELSPIEAFPAGQGYEPLVTRLANEFAKGDDLGAMEAHAAGLWRASSATDDGRLYQGAAALNNCITKAIEAGKYSLAMTLSRSAQRTPIAQLLASNNTESIKDIWANIRQAAGQAAAEIGAIEIPVDENDPVYPIYKSHSEYILGNLESSWELYNKNRDKLQQALSSLTPEYGLWLLDRSIAAGDQNQSEELVKQLTLWSRDAEGTFNAQQEASLRISYADLAFRRGALPTARALYRRVADAAEYRGSEMHLRAALGSVRVDMASKNYGAALEELDKLTRLRNPEFRNRIHYAKAEVLMEQENYKEALDELEAVLRVEPKHPDAHILRGKIHYQMRKLVEASVLEIGSSQEETNLVPGESLKINLRDPSLQVSGLGADIEVEIRAKSGDVERLLLHPFGDSKDKFRAEIVTALGSPIPGDKILQVLGEDEIRYGYSKRFRDRMDDLPPDPDTTIGVASDAELALTAGAFPAREGERQLDIEELGLSTAQKKLGTRAVRPGNNIYLRVYDPDRSLTPGIDEVQVELLSSSGDSIRKLTLTETSPFSGEFQTEVATAPAQAIAFASESTAGRDPNMAISKEDYPGWQAEVGNPEKARTFGVDLNDNVPLKSMTLDTGESTQSLTRFVLQTSMNGKDWTSVARFPEEPAVWDGRPQFSSIPTYRGGLSISAANKPELPAEWKEKLEIASISKDVAYLSGHVTHITQDNPPLVETGHPGYSGLFRFRAIFYQAQIAERTFRVQGLPGRAENGTYPTIFLIDGKPAAGDQEDPLTIKRELSPGLHTIEVWCHMGRGGFIKAKPKLLQDEVGKEELVECPPSMFDIKSFPEALQKELPQPATITSSGNKLDVKFGSHAQARMVRLVIHGFEGVAPVIRKLTLDNREGKTLLPVEQDYMNLRENKQLEVLPGDTITARYEDPVTATPKRNRHQKSLGVAFNTGTLTASFLNYEMNKEGERELVLEPIRRFRLDDAIAIVIEDADLDASTERDTVEFKVSSQEGEPRVIKALETEEHSGVFIGRVFPVEGEPSRDSEIKILPGGSLTATYLDTENLDPGIPTERTTTITHALYGTPNFEAYTITSEALPQPKPEEQADRKAPSAHTSRSSGPELITERRSLSYVHVPADQLASAKLSGLIGGTLNVDVIAPHLALASSSTVNAYVQTDAARKAAKAEGFNVSVPGTLKLKASLGRSDQAVPEGYKLASPPNPPTHMPALEEGRFKISIPLALGTPPNRSFADSSAEELPDSSIPEALAVKAGDIVHVGFPWKDPEDKVHWQEFSFTVGGDAMLDVMDNGYRELLTTAYVGEKVYLRVIAPGLDQSADQDKLTIQLSGSSGAKTDYTLLETEPHSGVFKSSFTISYADEVIPAKLPPVELNGFPVRYGETITISYMDQTHELLVKRGANGLIEPFSKRFAGDEMAVRTSFTLAECYFELAKKHREMDKESLARREIGQARKLLAEALATHRDESIKAHAEYLLGNLAQEFADLAKNEESKLPMYQDALARFTKIPTDWPDSEFAPKAQYKTALVYEKMGEIENAVEEYVKLAYKYPNDELIPMVMSRLGGYFQKKGQEYKEQADPLRENKDDASIAEVLRLDQLSYPEFLKAAMVFSKLQERFPEDALAGNAGLRAAQNLMRAHQYQKAIDQFQVVIDNESYDDNEVRSQAIYWSGLSYERAVSLMSQDNWKGRGQGMNAAYQLYRRVTFDFPDSKWAKYARGRLADPVFADIIAKEADAREKMLEALKDLKKKQR